MRPSLTVLLAGLLLAGCFMPASMANRETARNQARIRAEMIAAWQGLDSSAPLRGWVPVGDPYVGAVSERWDETDDLRQTFTESGRYTVAGICDPNCIDMDIVVLDGGNRRVGADLEPDATPIVSFDATAGVRYTFRVTVPNCRRPPRHPQIDEEPSWVCHYSTRVYRAR